MYIYIYMIYTYLYILVGLLFFWRVDCCNGRAN